MISLYTPDLIDDPIYRQSHDYALWRTHLAYRRLWLTILVLVRRWWRRIERGG